MRICILTSEVFRVCQRVGNNLLPGNCQQIIDQMSFGDFSALTMWERLDPLFSSDVLFLSLGDVPTHTVY